MVCPKMRCVTPGEWTCLVSKSDPHTNRNTAGDGMVEGEKVAGDEAEDEIPIPSHCLRPLLNP